MAFANINIALVLMALKFSIDQFAISVVLDGRSKTGLGTAFSFIQPHWVATAKHVVFEHGLPRDQLLVLQKQPPIPARILFAHPQVDLAVLELDHDLCMRPLFPAHHSLAGSSGLVCAGFAPSKSATGEPCVFVNEITSFQIEVRKRVELNEELVVFDASFTEGGHSGGPIFGAGGGVVGAIIENFRANGQMKARGTSLAPLVAHLGFVAPRG
jgi:Trypsin-like peptidase domain